uniref:Uncharacterized protein n=1 Tax=Branchiostoma floridae TaxID=7739 RepID=C3ZZ88_BRAFL|eukprot:XP_002586137.1 hypothetical protein BRAFLDRAFT_105923 [Branchiostoma floridae]
MPKELGRECGGSMSEYGWLNTVRVLAADVYGLTSSHKEKRRVRRMPSPHQFGAQPQVFLAPPGGPHAPLQVHYSAGQAPPQCGHTGGVAAAAAPQMYAQHPGAQSTEAPPMDTKTPLTA